MGRKSHTKSQNKPNGKQAKEGLQSQTNSLQRAVKYKLSPQKRNDVNQLVDKLLKVSSAVQSTVPPNASKEWETHLEIDKLLNKIRLVESEINIPLRQRDETTEKEFFTWLESNGAEINGVGIAQFPGYGYGLQAKRDLAEGEMMVAVPRKVMISHESIPSSLLENLFAVDSMVRLMPNVALSLFLLVERFRTDKQSFWAPYINMLPNVYTTVLYFSPQDMQELKGSPALEGALKQCRNIARQYAYFYKLFQNKNDPASEILREVFTYEQYRWAASTVMTRQNFIPSPDGNSMINALIPMWDMANHSNGKISTDFSIGQDRSECLAWRDFVAGEQVFIFYGARSNADLMVHNGFVYPQNKHDSFRIRLGVSKSDPLEFSRSTLLQRLDLPMAADFCLLVGSQPIEAILLAFLRVFNMNEEQLKFWISQERCRNLMYIDCALETELETKTWNFLLARIKLLLSLYPTTLQDDLKLNLEECDINKRLAIQLRICEKNILHGAKDYVEQRIKS